MMKTNTPNLNLISLVQSQKKVQKLWDRTISKGTNVHSNGAFPLHGTAQYGSVWFTFGGFSTG